MKRQKTWVKAAAALAILLAIAGCSTVAPASEDKIVNYTSFLDVPGVTPGEIKAIEELRYEYKSFNYGVPVSTEAYFDANGEISGFARHFCDWLSEFFGIPFKPVNYEFIDLLPALKSGELNFAGGLAPTKERKEEYYMTDALIERNLVIFRLSGSQALSEILKTRKLKLVFLKGSATTDLALSFLDENVYEAIYVDRNNEARQIIEAGMADGFVHQNTTDILFNDPKLTSEDFVPPAFISVCLTARDPKFAPVIAITQKAIENGQLARIAELYQQSEREYTIYKLFSRLNEEEIRYIKDHPVVPVLSEYDDYPVSFYNAHEKQWQGIFNDVLRRVSDLTGISFKVINNTDTDRPSLERMLKDGKAAMISGLPRPLDGDSDFIWADKAIMSDNPALISKTEFHHIELSELLHLKVGLIKGSVYACIFDRFFPHHVNIVEYEDIDSVFSALNHGDIDLVFIGESGLLNLSNYKEIAGYKINMAFDYPVEYSFGFNADETVLRSIFCKATNIIESDKIVNQWMSKTFDYRVKLAEAKLPWVIMASLSLMCVAVLALFLLLRKSRDEKNKHIQKMMEEIREANERTDLLLNAMPLCCHIWTRNLEMSSCNDENARLFKVSDKQELIDNFYKFSPEYQPDGTLSSVVAEREIKRAFDEGRSEFEYTHQTLDGTVLPTEITLVRVAYKDDFAVAAYIRDLREQKRLLGIAEQASEAKSSFLANMSHEMRTPLNAVIGLTGLTLEKEDMTVETRENLEKIHNAGMTLLNIVNDVLDISKIEAGRLELAKINYDVPSLINDTVTQNILRIGDKDIEFRLDIDADMYSRLRGDELRIKQILNNLLSNAIKYTEAGTVELGLDCFREENIVWLTIKVSDTGRGILEENLDKLFIDYYQVDVKANRKIEGTGLGLPITKRLTEMMNGELSVQSEYGKGSVFTVKIAQEYVNDARIGFHVADNLQHFRYSDEKRNQAIRFKRVKLPYARVLVVDDNLSNLDVAKGLLIPYEMKVDCVSDGEQAVSIIHTGRFHGEESRYDAIFMDLMMPGMDGMEATRRIRAIDTDYAKNIPIIALTANTLAGNDQSFADSGFQALLLKPIDLSCLDEVIRYWIRDKAKEKEYGIADAADAPEVTEMAGAMEDSGNTDELAYKIDGLDIDNGIERFGGADAYLKILRSFVINTRPLLEHITLPGADDLSDYAITVHGIKGSSRGICAAALGDHAERLEHAAKEGDLDYVREHNQNFLISVNILLADIENMLEDIKTRKPIPEKDKPDKEALDRLLEACESYDIDTADEVMKEISGYQYKSDDGLAAWLDINVRLSNFKEIKERLMAYKQ